MVVGYGNKCMPLAFINVEVEMMSIAYFRAGIAPMWNWSYIVSEQVGLLGVLQNLGDGKWIVL